MKSLHFGLVGDYQSGKSTLINCLIKRPIAKVGDGTSTTHTIVNYRYGENEHIEYLNGQGVIETVDSLCLNGRETISCNGVIDVYLNDGFMKGIIITDMPGFGFDDNDNKTSDTIMKKLDYAIVVMTNHKAIEEESSYFKVIQRLKKNNIPYYIILNCSDYNSSPGKWHPLHPDNINIARRDSECISCYKPLLYPFENESMPIVNLMWYWYTIIGNSDNVINRYSSILERYGFSQSNVDNTIILKASNFECINKIFDMDNRAYLELRKDFKEEIQKLKEELCPVGTIQAFAFPNIPVGWLECNGQCVEIANYPELYHTIGITFGGDGETCFNLPDLRNRFVRGYDENDVERKFGSYQEDALQNHSHEIKMSSSETQKDGSHYHRVGYEEIYFDYGSWTGGTRKCQSVKNTSDPTEPTYGDSSVALHSHKLPEISASGVSDFQNSKVKLSSTETRPKNVALLYCIKAENFCSADTSTESGYSTIVEKVKKELTNTVVPLSRTLRVARMGGEEYLANIEKIKQSHFCNRPSNRQDLIFATAQCFNDICFYNARIGPVFEGFDKHGLDLLVSWIIDKGMLEQKDKLSFIGDVKKFIKNLSSNIAPT